MYTRVRNIAIPLLELIEERSYKNDHPNLFVRIESKLALSQLKQVLVDMTQFAKETDSLRINSSQSVPDVLCKALEPLALFLSNRWDNIRKTDAVYFHAIYTPINSICCIIAKQLSEIYESHYYDLLMPTLKYELDDETYKKLIAFKKIHQFILSDDGLRLIDVGECLNQAEKDRTKILCHTNKTKNPLTKNEMNRIINHSRAAFNYYDAIQYVATHNLDISNSWQKNEFECVILKDTYKVEASYGDEGNEKLIRYILSSISSFSQLIDLMTHFMERHEWKAFIKAIDTDKLSQLTMEDDWLIGALQRKRNYNGDKNHDKAVLFCLNEMYLRRTKKRIRDKEEKNKFQSKDHGLSSLSWLGNYSAKLTNYSGSWLGSYGKKIEELGKGLKEYGKEWMGGYEPEEKEQAANVFQDFLMSDMALNELDVFLSGDPKREACRGALYQGELGLFTNQAWIISQPDYFFEEISNRKGMRSH